MEVVSGDNWSCETCKAPVQSSPPVNQHPTFADRMPFLCPVKNNFSVVMFGTHSVLKVITLPTPPHLQAVTTLPWGV